MHKPLNNTLHYTTVLDTTLFKDGLKNLYPKNMYRLYKNETNRLIFPCVLYIFPGYITAVYWTLCKSGISAYASMKILE